MQPLVSMLRPRTHEFNPSEGRGRRRRTLGEEAHQGKEMNQSNPQGILYNHKNQEPHYIPQEAHVTTFIHKINYG
jgi:hypothetical protein